MAETRMRRGRHSYVMKFGAAAALGVAADWLFLFQWLGANLGMFALALLAAVALLRRQMLQDWGSLAGLGAAFGFALMLVEDPSLLAGALYWCALAFAVLSPRTARFDHALRWVQRLAIHMALVPVGPVLDWVRWLKAKRRKPRLGISRFAPMLALPLIGSLIFLALFAAANPLISEALAQIDLSLIAELFSIPRIIVWMVAFAFVWAMLRPMATGPLVIAEVGDPSIVLPGVSVASVTLSLTAFNALFALQNGLDIAFLWTGAILPEGMTMTEYVHRGAYPLIATALLAALFVLLTMRPGSETARNGVIRKLVYLWTAQNVFLVASSALRTINYIQMSMLTTLRIEALIWMALVAVGLILICLRLWRAKSNAWLINTNFAAMLVVLAICTWLDTGRIAASWNVRHAREAVGYGPGLDLCYLNELGPAALLPIIELELRTRDPDMKKRLEWSRNRIMDEMAPMLADWHGWTFRDARRFETAHRIIAAKKLPRYRAGPRLCDGRMIPPPPVITMDVPAPATPPLTAEPNR